MQRSSREILEKTGNTDFGRLRYRRSATQQPEVGHTRFRALFRMNCQSETDEDVTVPVSIFATSRTVVTKRSKLWAFKPAMGWRRLSFASSKPPLVPSALRAARDSRNKVWDEKWARFSPML